MRQLKFLSTVGIVWYLIWFVFALFTPNDGGESIHILATMAYMAYFLYAIFHVGFGCFQGIKANNAVLKITSIIACVIIGIFVLLSSGAALESIGGARADLSNAQNTLLGSVGFSVPVAIAFSVIALIRSSRELRLK